jgi:hypothetical protein
MVDGVGPVTMMLVFLCEAMVEVVSSGGLVLSIGRVIY